MNTAGDWPEHDPDHIGCDGCLRWNHQPDTDTEEAPDA